MPKPFQYGPKTKLPMVGTSPASGGFQGIPTGTHPDVPGVRRPGLGLQASAYNAHETFNATHKKPSLGQRFHSALNLKQRWLQGK